MRMRCRRQAWLLGPVAIVAMMAFTTSDSRADVPVAGSQGTDTALPATNSQVTVNGRGAFADLAITINQTTNLSNQAVSITWTGGKPTLSGPGRFGSQYLQIMQCWGDDDGSVPGNPGPPPEQCEQGAVAGKFGGLPGSLYPAGFALSRVISRSDWSNFDKLVGVLDKRTTNVWLPFRAVDGTVVNIQTDPNFNPAIVGGNFWLNPYFNIITTNEIAAAVSGPDGSGAELFQVLTGVESSGLGCGQRTQPVPGAAKKIPTCWIVVVPRGTPIDENIGTPFQVGADQNGVVTSPVSPAAWRNRIAIPVGFNSVDSPCKLGTDERRISGSELALPAVASWQPSLCASAGLPPFSYAPVSDSSARQQLLSGQLGAPGMVVVSRAISTAAADPNNPVVYAPVSVSGLVIGFNVERNPTNDAPAAEQQLAGVRIAELNLTPRLVAKLLTQSYRQAVSIVNAPSYAWMVGNPAHMGLDPDFRQFNPEFELLQTADSRAFSSLLLPAGNSDAARQVWEWVFADPEARSWLNGEPDEWGMRINPVYVTSAAANSTGVAFGDPTPHSFPKADPYCYQALPRGPNNSISPPPLCGTDWAPYRRGFAESAQAARAASDGAKIVENPFAQSASEVWTRDVAQYLGRRGMLALTDTPSAALFGLQTARLSRAGDNGTGRVFVAPDTAGLISGVASMAAGAEATVLEPSPSPSPTAYPLTTITYAAIAPLALEEQERADYAAFIDYASGPGQVPGLELGRLPRGYAPLSESLRNQATTSANLIRTMVAESAKPASSSTTSTTSTTSTSTAPPQSSTANVVNTPPPPTVTTALPHSSMPGATNPSSSVALLTTTTLAAAPTSPTGAISSTNAAPSNTTRRVIPASVVPSSDVPTSSDVPASSDVPTGSDVSASSDVLTSSGVPTATSTLPISVMPSAVDAGVPASPSRSVTTPTADLAKNRYAVPGLGVMALGSALCALEITKRPRRRHKTALDTGSVPDEIEQG